MNVGFRSPLLWEDFDSFPPGPVEDFRKDPRFIELSNNLCEHWRERSRCRVSWAMSKTHKRQKLKLAWPPRDQDFRDGVVTDRWTSRSCTTSRACGSAAVSEICFDETLLKVLRVFPQTPQALKHSYPCVLSVSEKIVFFAALRWKIQATELTAHATEADRPEESVTLQLR